MAGIPTSVATVLDAALRRSPDKIALVAPDRTLTYAELDQAAGRAAAALHDVGLRAGDRLAVSLPNDSRIVVLFHAAMRSGAIWVGVNGALADAEQQAILADCGARLAIACRAATAPGVMSLSAQEWTELADGAQDERAPIAVDPHAAAAIAYTSGTTGRPKGVVHSQHNLIVPGAVLVADRGYDDTLRKADCLPLTILNLLVLSTLLTSQACGTSMISDVRDARRIVPWLADNGATVWNGVPPQLYDLVHDSSIDGPALDGLQEVWSGGDNLHEDVRTGFAAKFSPPICGTYGLTEAPTVVSIEKRGAVHAPGCSGIVLPHLRVTVDHLDELCVAARDDGPFAGLYTPMLGYWNNPEETSAALEGGVLRTGDIGTVTDAGELYVRDRRKLVIVRGGANVYPAEVEKALAAVPGVVAAALLAVPDERLGERVGAVVQITRPGAVDVDALVAHCRERLSRYKVPERWHLTDEPLPRNAMGKIDRTRLAPLLVDEQPG